MGRSPANTPRTAWRAPLVSSRLAHRLGGIRSGNAVTRNGTRDRILCVALLLACLLPFADKPFHIDDPLFVWTARRILEAPLDFFGFSLNWYGTVQPMHEVMKNPPLAAYAHAAVAAVAGVGERALHLGALLPAALAVLGLYSLAERLCARPLLATLAGLFTPVFLTSATSLGAEVPMLAAWLWAIRLWLRGLDEERGAWLAAAALLCAVATLTKYFALGLLPLLAIYTVARDRRFAPRLVWLLLPVAILAAYQLATEAAYGRGLLFDAASYAASLRAPADAAAARRVAEIAIGLVFAGGAVTLLLFFTPFLWSVPGALACVAGASVATLTIVLLPLPEGPPPSALAALWPQLALFALAGFQLVALGVRDLAARRDADSLLLGLALAGTLAFGSVFNWTVNVRSFVALAPVAGILVARGLERCPQPLVSAGAWRLRAALAAGAALALSVCFADWQLAWAARRGAELLADRHLSVSVARSFVGHWGFQYYLQERGLRPLDLGTGRLAKGDLVLIPENGTNVSGVPWELVTPADEIVLPAAGWISVLSPHTAAGFHAGMGHPLPYVFGPVPPERFRAALARVPLRAVDGRLVAEP
jgi:4-amino-4-deoxy-L-arabinose transferase-like glycosyltransferase